LAREKATEAQLNAEKVVQDQPQQKRGRGRPPTVPAVKEAQQAAQAAEAFARQKEAELVRATKEGRVRKPVDYAQIALFNEDEDAHGDSSDSFAGAGSETSDEDENANSKKKASECRKLQEQNLLFSRIIETICDA